MEQQCLQQQLLQPAHTQTLRTGLFRGGSCVRASVNYHLLHRNTLPAAGRPGYPLRMPGPQKGETDEFCLCYRPDPFYHWACQCSAHHDLFSGDAARPDEKRILPEPDQRHDRANIWNQFLGFYGTILRIFL